MPDDGKPDKAHRDLTRRRYVQAIAASTAAGLAGCNQGEGSEGGENNTSETTTTTTTTATTTTQGPPVSDTLTINQNTDSVSLNLNRWAESSNTAAAAYFRELMDPRIGSQADKMILSDREFEVPHIEGRDTVSIPTVTEEFRVEPPYDKYMEMNPDLTYWDGTPIDARSQVLTSRMDYYANNRKFQESQTFNAEATGDFKFHWWRNKGDVEGQEANPTNGQVLKTEPIGMVPFHPGFTEPYVQQFKDASNQDAVDGLISKLEGENITFSRLADESWGSGIYEIESSDSITETDIMATLREDHPNDIAKIPNLRVVFATGSRQKTLRSEGEIDLGGGAVLEKGGTINREILPDYTQEVDRWLTTGTDQVRFNWQNKHIARLWVRRAMVAAVDWEQAAINGWGSGRSIPITEHTWLADSAARDFFSEEFLDSLYEWPMEAQPEKAAEYMRKAGYTKENGIWTDQAGDQVELNYVSNADVSDWAGFVQTLTTALDNFGFEVDMTAIPGDAYFDALGATNLNYDIAQQWGGSSAEPFQAYWSVGGWWANLLVGGDPNDPSASHVDAETQGPNHTHDTVDTANKPLQGVQIPTSIGSIEAPEPAGRKPDLQAAGIDAETIDLATLIHSLRDPDITQEQYKANARKCARYYNYYLPSFKFHQFSWGMWGNVRDFDFAPRGTTANHLGATFNAIAGIIQPKYDEEYEKP